MLESYHNSAQTGKKKTKRKREKEREREKERKREREKERIRESCHTWRKILLAFGESLCGEVSAVSESGTVLSAPCAALLSHGHVRNIST